MHSVVTCCDANYLIKCLAFIHSFCSTSSEIPLYVFCLDTKTWNILQKINYPQVILLPIEEIETKYPVLQQVKPQRSIAEFSWTLKSFLIEYLFSITPENTLVTWLDTDIYFFSSAKAIETEIGQGSVLVHSHNHPPERKTSEKFGLYNAGMVAFRNNKEGRKVLKFWQEKCLKSVQVHAFDEEGNFLCGDQTYLNYFPSLSNETVVTTHLGIGIAPWNQDVFTITETEDQIHRVNGYPTVFYHFSACELFANYGMIPMKFLDYTVSIEAINGYYIPYLKALMASYTTLKTIDPQMEYPFYSLPSGSHALLIHKEILQHNIMAIYEAGYIYAYPLKEHFYLLEAPQLKSNSCKKLHIFSLGESEIANNLAPIVLICFKRLEHLKQSMEALIQNTIASSCQLYVFIDNGRTPEEREEVQYVLEYVKNIEAQNFFRAMHITLRSENYGCAKNVIDAQKFIFEKYNKMIYLEEDIVVNPYYLEYMQEALEYHKNDELAWCISGGNFKDYYVHIPQNFPYDTFYALCGGYGFAIWKDRWELIDFDLKDLKDFSQDFFAIQAFSLAGRWVKHTLQVQAIDPQNTWDVQVVYAQMKAGKFIIVPRKALCVNIGHDNSGLHCPSGSNPHLETELTFWKPQRFIKKYQLDFSLLLKMYSASGWYTSEEQKRMLMFSDYGWSLFPAEGEKTL